MNPNIEVINNKLWAVKYTYLPYIQEIDIVPDKNISLYEEPGRIAPGGLMILNKDHPGFKILKDLFPRLMLKSQRQLKLEMQNHKALKNKTDYQNLYFAMLQVEKERRLKERKGGIRCQL